MKTCHVAMIAAVLAGLAGPLHAAQAAPLGNDGQTWLAALDAAAAKEPAATAPAAAAMSSWLSTPGVSRRTWTST